MNSTATPIDRAFAALAYVMPLTSALGAGMYFLPFLQSSAPALANLLGLVLLPLSPLIAIESNPILGLGIFILLFAFVIREPRISRFIRFNVLQAIMVSFIISIGMLILNLLGITQLAVVGEALLNVFFLGGMAIVVYGVAQSVLGRYAEIPSISDAVNMQIPS
ncbi:MAG: Tic20 family protein [Phormidesmis sp.]